MRTPNRRIVVLGVVVVAACAAMSISWAAQKGGLSLAEITRRLLGLEDRVARLENRLDVLERADAQEPDARGKEPMLEIISPKNGDEVSMNVIVEAAVRVDDLAGRFPVVGVHPMLTNLIWIQPLPVRLEKTEQGYRFRSRAYCGTVRQGIGEKFELFVLLPKKGALKEADQLDKLPKDVPVSPSVLVTRTN